MLLGLIAAAAAALSLSDIVRSARRIAEPGVAPGLLLVAAALLLIGGLAVAGARAGTEGRRHALVVGSASIMMVALRLASAWMLDAPVDRDMRVYHALAERMLVGECCFSDYPTGYPILLAAAYRIFGAGAAAGELLNVLAASIGGIALYRAVLVVSGHRAAAVAIVLYAAWPAGVLLSTVRLTETVYAALLLVAVWATVESTGSWKGSALVGALLAIAQYVRPITVAFLPAFILARLVHQPQSPRTLVGHSLSIVAVFLLLLLPVIEHNDRAHGELSVATSSYGGWSLFVGTNQETGGRWNETDAALLPTLTAGDLWEDSKVAGQLGVQRILDDPVGFALLAVRKFGTLWAAEDYGAGFSISGGAADKPQYTFVGRVSQLFYASVVLLATLGVYVRRARLDSLHVLIILLTATVAVVHSFLEVRDRYHAYLVPLFIAIASPIVVEATARWWPHPTPLTPSVEAPILRPDDPAA